MGALRIERDDDVLRVTFARPETRNAFDAAMIAELAEAFVDVGNARAVVLAGDGPSFCAGADIDWMRTRSTSRTSENVADANALRRLLDAIDTCPAPVIALVQGHAIGGGAGLVAVADIAVAHERTVFAFSEVKLGIIPAVISPYALRKIGESAARRYFVTGERFDAATALRIGLVHEIDGRSGRVSHRSPRRAAHRRPARVAGSETARARPPGRARDSPAHRRAASERRGTGGLAGVPRAGRPRWAPAPRRHRRVTALLAIASAGLIGGADFIGGIASRTATAIRVAAFAQAAGTAVRDRLSIAYGADRLTRTDVGWSVLAGVVVAVGLGAFYTAMGRGLISVVAPVAALTGAVIPVVYGLATRRATGDGGGRRSRDRARRRRRRLDRPGRPRARGRHRPTRDRHVLRRGRLLRALLRLLLARSRTIRAVARHARASHGAR